jgi:mannose-1-phosphate guanylyltransferase
MANQHHYGLILAGGRGTRFWPKSRTRTPKQLLPFLSDRSLLQETVERLNPTIPPERIWILTNEHLRKEIRRQLPEVPSRQILAEPAARNTAPCLGLASRIVFDQDPRAVLGVFPADHHIGRPAAFRRLLKPAFLAAEEGHLVTLGIPPRWPETGYGYLEFPSEAQPGDARPWPLRSFREKPDAKTARRFLAAGRFYWNAGMFFWRAGVFLDALRRHLPRTAAILASLPSFTHRGFTAALRKGFPLCEGISVDYAVMEKAGNVVGIPAGDIGWNDLGSWQAVYELLPRDAQGNVARAAELLAAGSEGNYVEANGKLVALLGVRDLVIVEAPGVLLVADRARAQQVGDLVKKLETLHRTDLL